MTGLPARRQRRYRARKAAGLVVLRVAIPAELLADLQAAALIGEHADAVDPEVEALVESVLHGYLAVTRNDTPET